MTESLADDVAAFLQLPGHGSIQVDMEERVSPEIVRGVREGLASLGVCWDAADIGNLESRPYRCDHLCIAVPRNHPLAGSRSLRLLDTLEFEHVSLPVNSAVQIMLQRHAAQAGRRLMHRVIVTNFEAALRVVRAGLAISVVPREVVRAQAADAALKLIPLAEPWAQRRFIICYRGTQTLTPAAQLLVEHLSKLAKA
jgi:DNA-binding transcriptional LysR family regulator